MHPIRPSNTYRAKLCPPSIWRELESPQPVNPAASQGSVSHAAIANVFRAEPEEGLIDPGLAAIVYRCEAYVDEVLAEYGVDEWEAFAELPVEICDEAGELIIERGGTLDLLIVPTAPEAVCDMAIFFDWKTGYKEPDVPVKADPQFFHYSIGAHRHTKRKTIIGCRFHPNVWTENRESRATFGGTQEIWNSYAAELRLIVSKSTPTAQAVPGGRQCRFCAARFGHCPEYHAQMSPDGWPVENIMSATPDRVGEILARKDDLRALQGMMEEAEQIALALFRQADVDPDFRRTLQGTSLWENFERVESEGRRKIVDPPEVLARLQSGGRDFPIEAFLAGCTVGITKLQRAFRSVTGLKGKAATAEFDRLVGPLIEKGLGSVKVRPRT